ncbi:hypothetical protein ScPMuIL_001669 [Solemya velum]
MSDDADADYVCSLDSASEKKAKEELNEDPKERLGAVQTLRTWVNQQKWFRTPTAKMEIDGKNYDIHAFMRAAVMIFEAMFFDENCQHATPARIKEMHYYNIGPLFEAFMTVFKSFMKEKLRKRCVSFFRYRQQIPDDMSADDNYVCSLDSASEKKAREELHEDPKERLGAVQALRTWVNERTWIHSPTDTLFLLQILRARKFSQLAARELLENYWKYRTMYKEWYRGTDPSDPKVQYVWKHGVHLMLPGRDKNGRKVVLARIGNMEITGENYDSCLFMRAAAMLFEATSFDENCQVNGMIIINDLTGFSMKHQTFFGMDNSKKSMEIFEKATPARVKEMHYYNIGPVFEALMGVFKPFMKEKMRKRLRFHGQSLVSLYKEVDMAMLPKEYLPDDYDGPNNGTIEEIIQKQTEYMNRPEIQAWLKLIHNPENGYDASLKPKDDEPAASFRKLNVS